MRNLKYISLIMLPALTTLNSCRTAVAVPAEDVSLHMPPTAGPSYALPPVVIYRMRGDYANLVPITLDDSHTRIVSYPAPSDIRPSAAPQYIGDGWYLDRRGIGKNTVMTSYTYDEYSALPSAPTPDELLRHIIDYHPFTEIRDCGREDPSLLIQKEKPVAK